MKTFKFGLASLLVLGLAIISLTSCKDDKDDVTRIYGTITMEGLDVWQVWQDSGEVQVTIFPEFSLNPLSGWGAIPDSTFGPGVLGGTFAIGAPYNAQDPVILTFVPGQTEYTYSIDVEPGEYSALAVGFRHDHVNDPSRKTATLGVHWDNPTQVSHGVQIRANIGGNIVNVLNYPAPVTINIAEGEELEINFKADFGFVEAWY